VTDRRELSQQSVHDSPRYRPESRIATGGMGEVWRAHDLVLDREVALKLLKAEYADDPTFRSRFTAEARHAASLTHPNVASVFDFGEVDATDGSGVARPFLVMELVPGTPLSELLGEAPLSPEVAADLVAQAADGIGAAHALGIVHRDVKPANLMVTPDRQVKVTDFGIARAADAVPLTQTGQIVGTPHRDGRPRRRAMSTRWA
jgi:serine/threonine protein kinase